MNNKFVEAFTCKEKINGTILFIIYSFLIVFGGSIIKITNNIFLIDNMTFIVYLILFLLVIIMFWAVLKTSISNINGNGFTCLAIIGFITLAMNVAAGIFLSAIGVINENNEAVEETIKNTGIFMILSVIIFAPVAEEIIYRFFIFRLIRNKNLIFAHLITAIIFGFSHVWGYVIIDKNPVELLSMLPTFFMSLGFSILYEKTKSLAFPIMPHMIINIIAL